MAEKRVLVVLENPGYTPRDIPKIRAELASSLGGARARLTNIRVSNLNIQADLFVDCGAQKLEDCVGRLLGEHRPQDIVDLTVERYSASEPERVLERAAQLFNQERFWEVHEAIETLWRAEPPGPRKELLQGVILVAAAFVHKQKNREEVGLKVLGRALQKLKSAKDQGKIGPIDTQTLIARVEAMLRKGIMEPFRI